MNYSAEVKDKLFSLINEMNQYHWLFTRSPEDKDTYSQAVPGSKGYNLMHLNALYDLRSRTYIDVVVQTEHTKNENRAMCDIYVRFNVSV